jgi:23S rRNA (uracil1939-C5)-methyltransferase
LKLSIEKAVYGGAGLARCDGKAVFVPGTLPGEEVEAILAKQKASFAEAKLVSVLTASPDRVAAPCPYYGVCGGCQYQHADYAAQLRMKRGILEETLGRAGLRELPAVAVHAGEPLGYRNRIRLHVEARTHAVGYLQRSSHRLLAVAACPIAAPGVQEALSAMQAVAASAHLGDWCAEAELFLNDDGSELLLSLHGRAGASGTAKQLDSLCAALGERIPQLTGARFDFAAEAVRGPTGRNRRRIAAPAQPSRPALHWGAPALTYRTEGASFRVSAGAFFQANRFLVDTLAGLVVEADGEKVESVWDLYAGVGLFSGALTRQSERVTAVEGAPISAGDLRVNLAGHTVVEASALSFLQSSAKEGHSDRRPDRIVLDPPRAGLGAAGAEAMAQVHSRSITYVSCDPATLARDLAVLVHAGYTTTRLDLIDMFPQTFHLETVARLRLR